MHRTTTIAPGIIAVCTDGQIGHAVTVQVTQRRHRTAEPVIVAQRRAAADVTGDFGAALGRAIGVHQQHMHRTTIIAPGIIAAGTDSQIDHPVTVEVTQRRHRNSEIVTIDQRRPAADATGDFGAALGRAGARIGDGEHVVFHFSITGRADRILGLRIGAQAEPRVRAARRADRYRRERECHTAIGRASRSRRLRPFAGVVEHAVPVVIDPTGERRLAAGRIGHQQRHRGLCAYRAQQVQWTEHAVFVIRQCTVHVVRIGARVLQRARVIVNCITQEQTSKNRVLRSAVTGQSLIVASSRVSARVRCVTKVKPVD